jgi:hypothetical protein
MQVDRCADTIDREIIMFDLANLREGLRRGRNRT